MSESHRELEQIIAYMKAHWPSPVKPEWQIELSEYPAILTKILSDFTIDATRQGNLFRIAGLSGSGKTTQILPAVEAYCEKVALHPILIAARRFVEYHPHYSEIKDFYGEKNLRKMTDEFSTIMLFLTLSALTEKHYDIILDVTLLDPKMEAILLKMLTASNYQTIILMITTSPTVTEHFLSNRAWRHAKTTEQEFIRATSEALNFYATKSPDLRIILWSVYDRPPIYDGTINQCLNIFADYSNRTALPSDDDDARRDAKIKYLLTNL
ncbi:zeta toxin family protein [Candidatus Saccharibacteria bacterium]|nr:zeta toxin family protein [Candidatus Saccharibacteria bacterium]